MDGEQTPTKPEDSLKSREHFLHKLEVLHKSEDYLVVNKDFDVVINTNDQPDRLTLCDQVKARFPELIRPELVHGLHIVHRLDFSTSGVLLFPVHKKAASSAMKVFAKRKTSKFYLALVHGHLKEDRVLIDLPIGTDSRPEYSKLRMCSPAQDYCVDPREARTRLVVIERGSYNRQPATKIMLAPESGRRHQLRVHMKELGHTIVGDYTYSDRQDTAPHRMFLHAYRLIVPSPLEWIDVRTEDPFTEADPANLWSPEKAIVNHDEAFSLLANKDLAWNTFKPNE